MPRVEPFYAIKCNPNDIVVKMLAKLKIGFDCASKSEISQALASGVTADRIIYANPCKQASNIKYAQSNGVRMMTFDSVAELRKISAYHSSALLVLRIFVGATKALCPLGLKFGAQISDVPELLATAQSLSLEVIGVSFHVGSGCFDASAYQTAILLSRKVFDIGSSMNISMSLLDIGGGFPGNLDTQQNLNFFENVCDTINSCIDLYFPEDSSIRIIAEPGRYYVSSAFHLACTVTSLRVSQIENSLEDSYSYFLNDGVYGSFNCIVFDHYIGDHYLLSDVYGEAESYFDESTYPSIYWGPTCDSADKILENFRIRKISIGECIVFKNMGAYTMAAASTFNGFQIPFIQYYSTFSDWEFISPLLLEEDYTTQHDYLNIHRGLDSEIDLIPVEMATTCSHSL
uniref:Ornithine decarboxylase (Trinotate prediction) n=1 Tax=Henneguya salminicola TaxID=69463 RepID=A0A6G3MF66_HENSL